VFNRKGIIYVSLGKTFLFCIIIFQLLNHVHLPYTAFHWSILFAEVQTKLVSMWSLRGKS
jgi:hypothetical protein